MKKLLFILLLGISFSCTSYTCPTYASKGIDAKKQKTFIRPVTNKTDLLVSFGVVALIIMTLAIPKS